MEVLLVRRCRTPLADASSNPILDFQQRVGGACMFCKGCHGERKMKDKNMCGEVFNYNFTSLLLPFFPPSIAISRGAGRLFVAD